MKIDTLYRTFKVFKAVSELAYLTGFWIGQKKRKRKKRRKW